MSTLNFICLGDSLHENANFSVEMEEAKLKKYMHPRYGECWTIRCPFCGKRAKHIGYKCTAVLLSWEMDMNLGDRAKYGKDMIQRFRGGELSREFVETYPHQVKGMIEKGVVTKEQVRKSKYLYTGDMRGLENLPHQGAAAVLGKE